MATGFVKTVPQLYGARFLLGLAEAGLFPGIVLYLTYWSAAVTGARDRAFHDRSTYHQHSRGTHLGLHP